MTVLRPIPESDGADGTCPRRFCFHFAGRGGSFADGVFDSEDEAVAAAQPVPVDCCAHPFWRCRRLGVDAADKEGYEPHEPNLDAAGLAHTHFVRR